MYTPPSSLKPNSCEAMSYNIKADQKFEDEFERIKKRNKSLHEEALKKIIKLSEEPHIGKPLRNVLKGKRRVHLGHFVLLYEIDEVARQIILLQLKNHKDAYDWF